MNDHRRDSDFRQLTIMVVLIGCACIVHGLVTDSLYARVRALEAKAVEQAKQHDDAVGAASEEWPLCPTTP